MTLLIPAQSTRDLLRFARCIKQESVQTIITGINYSTNLMRRGSQRLMQNCRNANLIIFANTDVSEYEISNYIY